MGFDYRAIFLKWFCGFFGRVVPLEDSPMFWIFRSKAFYFFLMAFEVQLFVIVPVAGYSSGYIIGEK